MRHGLLRLALLAAIVTGGSVARAQDLNVDSSEYLIKAGFVYNFAKLVEWSPGAAQTDQPIVIGVLGNNAFAETLGRVVDGKNLDGRPFVVRTLRSQDFRDCRCHILFVGSAERTSVEEIIRFQESASVLTVSEASDFARDGGIIAFVLQDNKIRFEVNVEAAKRADLAISSRLLSLATIVRTTR